MKEPTTVTPGDLVKVWSLSKSSEYRQMTLRVPGDVFYKLQALERMFPTRSRNEMASDLLTTALDQFADGLRGECLGHDEDGPIYSETLASNQFWEYFRDAKAASVKSSDSDLSENSKSGQSTMLKVVETQEQTEEQAA